MSLKDFNFCPSLVYAYRTISNYILFSISENKMELSNWFATLLRGLLLLPFIAMSVARDVLGMFIPALKPGPESKQKRYTYSKD